MHWDDFGLQFWHWWHGWHWYFGFYQWLEVNNLWKATVAFAVTLALSVLLAAIMRPWKAWRRHRDIQEKIADRLDTSTPGGMTDVVKALRTVLDQLDEGEEPDDNGSDQGNQRRLRGAHHAEANEHIPNPLHGGPTHGGGSAAHR